MLIVEAMKTFKTMIIEYIYKKGKDYTLCNRPWLNKGNLKTPL